MRGIMKTLRMIVMALPLVALAACGGAAAPASTPAASSAAAAKPASSVPAAAASASAKPAASAAAKPAASGAANGKPSAGASAAAGGPIKIGLIETLTGTVAQSGIDNRDGLQLYLDSLNGTIAGRQVQLVVVDDQGQADVALAKAKQLVEVDKVQMISGIQFTPVCYAIAGYVKEAKVPLAVIGNCGAQGLTTDPKFASPYVTRFTETADAQEDPAAAWAAEAGLKKTIIVADDYQAGIQHSDFFASALISRGGSIVQTIYPAQGTTDFGPFLASLNGQADSLALYSVGLGALRFVQQYGNYVGNRKLQIVDMTGQTTGANLAQLQDKALGIVPVNQYYEPLDSPANQAFQKAWKAKFPTRAISYDGAHGWGGGQIIAAALQKVNGQIEDTQKFMDALYATDVATPKGQVKLDQTHDVVQAFYAYQHVKNPSGSGVTEKLLKTYPDVGQYWDRTQQQLEKFPFGTLKNKWVGVTKDQLSKIDGLTTDKGAG